MIEAIIHKWAKVPFAYGADCCQFAGEIVEAWTGKNPMRAFSYANEREAMAIIAKHGGLKQALIDTLGEPAPDVPKDRGVVICHQQGASDIVGVAWKGRCVVRSTHGVTDWPLEAAYMGWAV